MTTDKNIDLVAAQVRAARALLGWSQLELARRANVATSTVADFERGKRMPLANNLDALSAAFKNEHVRFLPGGAVAGPSPSVQDTALASGGKPIRLIEAGDLSEWADRLDSKGMFPQLIHRLILATTRNQLNSLCFRATDSIHQEGWDGVCEQYVVERMQWLPPGNSGWELSTQRAGISGKANDDYIKRTDDSLELDRHKATFVFASLRSWPKGKVWAKLKRDEGKWADVRVLDVDDLVHWIELYPSVGYWVASHLGKLPPGFLPLIDGWKEWRLATQWPLTADIVLAGRDDEAMDTLKWLRGRPSVRSIQADSPDDAIAFLYASIELLPQPHQEFYLMRSLRVFSAEAARVLGDSSSPLIIVMETSEPGLAARLAQQGHHVFVAYGSGVGVSEVSIVLPRPTHEAFQSALENMGLPADRTGPLTRDSVRSLAILRRLIPAAWVKDPGWAEESNARVLIPALLAGAWDSSREGDRLVLQQLSGESFERFESRCTSLVGFPDAPLRHAGTTWKIASPRDAWFRLAKLIGKADLDRFESVAKSVLGASDPRFEIDPDDRWLAGVRGQLPEHSPWLVAGLTESLLLLAIFDDRVTTVASAEHYASKIVGDLFKNADARRWYSLSDQLRALAEAAPLTFLNAVETGLEGDSAPIMTLFQEDGGPLMGSANHTNLLWALETLAWSFKYLGRVSEILARMSMLDPGGTWSNRPESTLQTIFLLWMPQTYATLAQRLKVLDRLRSKEPDATWKLMLKTLPGGFDSVSPNPKPRWRDFSTEEPEVITYALIAEGAAAISEGLLIDAGSQPGRWVELIESFTKLPPDWRKRALTRLKEIAILIGDDPSRMLIWAALRKLLGQHRSFPEANWSLSEGELYEIESVYGEFEPVEHVNQRSWLFSSAIQLVEGQQGNDWEARTKELFKRRQIALGEVLTTGGLASVRRLINEAEQPDLVGVAFGQHVTSSREADAFLRELIGEDDQHVGRFVDRLIAVLNQRFGPKWTRSVFARAKREKWERRKIIQILLALPIEMATWDIAATFGDEANAEYWKRVSPFWLRGNEAQAIRGVEQLLKVGRARAAVRAIAGSQQDLPTELVVRMLTQAADEPWSGGDDNDPVMDQWSVCQLLQRLDQSPEVSEDQLARLEWFYLALLEHSARPPIVLHRLMSRNPSFFIEVLSAAYRPRSGDDSDNNPPTTHIKAVASQAFRLIQSWNLVPGSGSESIDSLQLSAWVREAHGLAVVAERGAIGDVYIGQVLAFSQIDKDGAWPDKAVRQILDEMKNDHIENGIVSGVHNKRGVTTRGMLDGGAQERNIAERYKDWAEMVRFEWPRTASLLDRISHSFEETARHYDENAELTDWTY